MRKKVFLLFSILFCTGQFAFAQVQKDFPSDPKEFFESLNKFIEATNPDLAEPLMDELRVIWTSDRLDPKDEEKLYKNANKCLKKRTEDESAMKDYVYSSATSRLTDDQKKDIIRTCNTMLKKRMKAVPDFKNYLYALISFKLSNQTDESFKGWQASLDKLLERANKFFASYINGCNNLFAGNYLYLSPTTRWQANNRDYSFEFDSLPKVVFKGITLTCLSKNDSSVIRETKGTYYPTIQTWKGTGGHANFMRAGLDEATAYAELSRYSIDVSGSDFTADSVKFNYPKYFPAPILGRYSDKILADVKPETATYPRFETYAKILSIRNIATDVDYVGGFSLQGRKVLGTGTSEQSATLTFYLRGKPFLVAKSHSFIIRPEKITSDRTGVSLYLDTVECNPHCDSIHHPSLQFKYIVADRSLSLIRTEEGVGNSPFFDSFHKIDIYCEGIYWKIDEPLIDMRMLTGGTESRAHFESASYFRDSKFNKYQGISDVHPFTLIKKFTEYQRSRYIYANELARYMKASDEQVRALLISLATQGFILYNVTEDRFFVEDRLFYYILAKVGKTDYDVIQIESSPISEKSNAKMNLQNFDLTIMGVNNIQVSDSQSVSIIPKERQIVMKKNRDFTFSGKVNAGRFEYYGKNFSFDYDDFRFNLDFIDSMRIKIPGKEKDAFGNPILEPVKTVIQYINGNLLIDNPGNKSGIKDFPDYPIFNSFKDSYVFYDRGSIQQGVYKKDNFYFHLEPFVIDSLNSFDPAGLGLQGTFVSAGIFPDFDELLKIQPDNSLGFSRSTPEAGYPVYGGKATYLENINMSHNGLLGKGELDYVTSVSKSDKFIFYPDSMNSNVNNFEVKKQGKPIEFPPVLAEVVYEHWRPYKDKMWIYQRKSPIDFYDAQAYLTGSMELTPQLLTGKGTMSFVKAELISNQFKFRETAFSADTSNFNLKSDEVTSFAFQTVNVNSEIDFVTRTGLFKSNGSGSFVNFPVNEYICYMDQFKWFMDDEEIEMSVGSRQNKAEGPEGKANLDLEGSEFISTNKDQDSLRWIAPYAKYSLKDYIIHAEEVKYMRVADATLFPDSGKVTVHKKAKMETFNNARIMANSITKYHEIYNVTADVTGRKSYNGSGDYDYLDIYKKKQTIHFSKIDVDTTGQTTANSTIPDTTNFTLIPQISFKGDVTLNASHQFLNYSGYGKLNINCEGVSGSWFQFTAEINPAEVFIPLAEKTQNDKNNPLATGLAVFNDTASFIYTALLAPKKTIKDVELLNPKGYLLYDKVTNEYKISSKEKLLNKTLPGDFFVFNDTKCTSYGEGKLNFGAELGQMKITAPGSVKNNMNNMESEMNTMLLFDFFFSDDALKEMADIILATPTLVPADNGRAEYEKGLAEIVGKEKAGKLITELNLFGSFKKVPPELMVPVFLTDVKMNWSDESRSYRSSGPISIGNVLKHQLNKQMQGQIEIIKKKNGDIVNIYLEADPQNWFYFRYTKGVMEAVSSSTKFNDIIRNLKSDKRTSKGDKEKYEFILSSEKKKSDFLRKSSPVEEGEDK